MESARDFVVHATSKHGDAWKLMHCDNLSARLANAVKQLFWDGKVFICFLPKETTESIQPIDTAYERSLRYTLGNILDMWLMEEDNLLKWEQKITAGEWTVLINNLVAEATEKVMKKDDTRINCFVGTGCLIHYTKFEADDLIKPQGLMSKMVVPDYYAEDSEMQNSLHLH